MTAEERHPAEPDPAELSAYMDEDGELSNDRFVAYLRQRYGEIKSEYEVMLCNLREAEGAKREDIRRKLLDTFLQNYRSRKWVVRELRKHGETVEDRHVPA